MKNNEYIFWAIIFGLLCAGYLLGTLLFGALAHDYFQKVTQTVVVATTTVTVSIVKEKQECNKAGGMLLISGTDVVGELSWYQDQPSLNLTCIKPTSNVISSISIP